MNDWQKPLTEDIVKRELESYSNYQSVTGLFGIYINNKPVYLTTVRIYMSKARALVEIKRKFKYRLGSDGKRISKKELDKIIDNLIEQKVIEIREL